MDIDKLIERRAVMDVHLDIQSDQLWGEEEIVNCIDEIKHKIRDTLYMISHVVTDDVNLEVAIKQLYKSGAEAYYKKYVSLWQQSYRVEKMFYSMATSDHRYEQITRKKGVSMMNPFDIDF